MQLTDRKTSIIPEKFGSRDFGEATAVVGQLLYKSLLYFEAFSLGSESTSRSEPGLVVLLRTCFCF